MTFDEAKLQPPPMSKDDMFVSGPVFGWDEASKQATVTFSIEKAGQVYQRVLVLSPVRVLGGTK